MAGWLWRRVKKGRSACAVLRLSLSLGLSNAITICRCYACMKWCRHGVGVELPFYS
jgi:hypothetical protein